jgi:hypothetical protein
VVGVVLLIVIGVGVGVGVSKSHKSSPKSAAAAGSSSNSSGVVQQTNPNDPSSFVKNPALKQAFYGLAYTPYGSQLPTCNNSLGACCFCFILELLGLIGSSGRDYRHSGGSCARHTSAF